MNIAPQKFILAEDETWQFRKARSVDESLARAVRHVCEANDPIRACYLLDARKKAGADVKFVIALSLDDEAKDMGGIVVRFQEVLGEYPSAAPNTIIMSGKRFERDFAGAEFYVRIESAAETLQIPIDKALRHKCAAVDLQLYDGSVVENLAIDASGLILGKIVGGQDGIDESPLPFKQEDIEAYRFRAGLAARLGLAKWRRLSAPRRCE